ncbi:MAG: YggS family pyridoxal phosphate-dependent enzyme [Actinomycetales bacterium]
MRDARSRELEERLDDVRARIERASQRAGRSAADLTLIVVTKTWPAEDVRRLASLGVTDVGENRHQEAQPKREANADLTLTWHFIGQLQSNKARAVVGYADVIHSVDRLRLVAALGRAAAEAGRVPTCLIQVDLDPAADAADAGKVVGHSGARGGARPGEVPELADAVASSPHLQLGGVMGVAPLGGDARQAFDRLAAVSERLRRDHPAAVVISAGMSGDLEQAVAAGATHLRVGTAILGSRPPLG